MNSHHEGDAPGVPVPEESAPPAKRKPYSPPAIESEDEFERRALGCSQAMAPKTVCGPAVQVS